MTTPKILIFSGSIRAMSHNTRLAGFATKVLSQMDCEVTRISLADYDLPIYNGDLEDQKGVPRAARQLAKLFHQHHALLIASPEYNGSITPLLINTLDWVSRVSSDKKGPISPYKGKFAAMIAASPGMMGGVSSLAQLRPILSRLGMLVISEQVTIGGAAGAFDEMENLKDERSRNVMDNLCKSLVEKAAVFNLR